ncbi:hypothetical protein VKS41_008873 [Umbelopsis sp. WA50703]
MRRLDKSNDKNCVDFTTRQDKGKNIIQGTCYLGELTTDSLARSAGLSLEVQMAKKIPRVVLCIGQAGTGVGSRIDGHLRYGVSQLRRRHRRYAMVAMTNEHNSSQACSVCMSPVV